MNGIIKFTEDSPYYLSGEQERKVFDLKEVHYCYDSFEPRTAFEFDDTGFTVKNAHIKEFEIIKELKGE